MKMYQVRFFLETMAVLFEQRSKIHNMLDDMATRMEELEVELEDIMVNAGFNVNGDKYSPWRGRFDDTYSWANVKIGLDDDEVCGCSKPDCVNCQPSYRMD